MNEGDKKQLKELVDQSPVGSLWIPMLASIDKREKEQLADGIIRVHPCSSVVYPS
jgi:hypothetical protein